MGASGAQSVWPAPEVRRPNRATTSPADAYSCSCRSPAVILRMVVTRSDVLTVESKMACPGTSIPEKIRTKLMRPRLGSWMTL